MKRDIFNPRTNIKPAEYPHLIEFGNAILASFWTAEHFTYDIDVLAFRTKLPPAYQEAVKRSMLAIGVVENKVKSFWARIDMRMPKPEIALTGHIFASNEAVHQMAYEKLLHLLGLDEEFKHVMEVECMKGRAAYLSKYLEGVNSRSNREFTKSLILFTLLIENASLFTQFLTISSFEKYMSALSNFNTVVTATSKEEVVHAMFGEALIKIIREENPEWFDADMEAKVMRNVKKAYEAECKVIDWIFEHGELEFLPKVSIKEYLKTRLNESLVRIGYSPLYEVDETLLAPTQFFEVQVRVSSSFDFFKNKSTDYSSGQAFTADNLFD